MPDGATPDLVHAPPHYRGGGLETITVIEDRVADPGAHLGTAIKYICRAGRKAGNPASQDLDKAVWYVKRARAWIGRGGRCASWQSVPSIDVRQVVVEFDLDANLDVAISYIAQALTGPTFAEHWLGLAVTQIEIAADRLRQKEAA